MDDALTEKIKAVLSNPAALAQITEIASSMSGGQTPPPAEAASTLLPGDISSLAGKLGIKDRNTQLLYAIKPFLRSEKQEKIDNLIRAMSVASLIGNLKKGGNI